jgi:hypothetical protein
MGVAGNVLSLMALAVLLSSPLVSSGGVVRHPTARAQPLPRHAAQRPTSFLRRLAYAVRLPQLQVRHVLYAAFFWKFVCICLDGGLPLAGPLLAHIPLQARPADVSARVCTELPLQLSAQGAAVQCR